jgi:hypothetical protein
VTGRIVRAPCPASQTQWPNSGVERHERNDPRLRLLVNRGYGCLRDYHSWHFVEHQRVF